MRSQNGTESDWLSVNDKVRRFTHIQLDGFIVLWKVYNPQEANDTTPVKAKPRRAPRSRAKALKNMFPIGFILWKEFGGGIRLQGKMFDVHRPYWRVRYSDQD